MYDVTYILYVGNEYVYVEYTYLWLFIFFIYYIFSSLSFTVSVAVLGSCFMKNNILQVMCTCEILPMKRLHVLKSWRISIKNFCLIILGFLILIIIIISCHHICIALADIYYLCSLDMTLICYFILCLELWLYILAYWKNNIFRTFVV